MPGSDDDFGSWLDDQLGRRGWSRAELARRMDVWPSLISKWGNNEQRPRPAQCRGIAEAFGIDPDTVLEAAGHRPREQAPGIVRHEARVLLDRIPETLIAPVIPMLRSLTDAATQQETEATMRRLLRGPKEVPNGDHAKPPEHP